MSLIYLPGIYLITSVMYRFMNIAAPWGAGEKGYLFSGSWEALVIILGELGSKLIVLGF